MHSEHKRERGGEAKGKASKHMWYCRVTTILLRASRGWMEQTKPKPQATNNTHADVQTRQTKLVVVAEKKGRKEKKMTGGCSCDGIKPKRRTERRGERERQKR